MTDHSFFRAPSRIAAIIIVAIGYSMALLPAPGDFKRRKETLILRILLILAVTAYVFFWFSK